MLLNLYDLVLNNKSQIKKRIVSDRIERRTYSYNSSSIVAGTTYEDLGTIASTPATAEDYGSVTSAYLPPNTDHGDLVILPGDENPMGLFKITGGDKEFGLADK